MAVPVRRVRSSDKGRDTAVDSRRELGAPADRVPGTGVGSRSEAGASADTVPSTADCTRNALQGHRLTQLALY